MDLKNAKNWFLRLLGPHICPIMAPKFFFEITMFFSTLDYPKSKVEIWNFQRYFFHGSLATSFYKPACRIVLRHIYWKSSHDNCFQKYWSQSCVSKIEILAQKNEIYHKLFMLEIEIRERNRKFSQENLASNQNFGQSLKFLSEKI